MKDKHYKIAEIASLCTFPIILACLIALWLNLTVEKKQQDNRIAELEGRLKYIEYRLMETERPICIK